MTHTPKPWKILTEAEGFAGATTGKDLGIIDKNRNIIAEVFHQLDDDLFAPVEANAQLIENAPEMLKVLKAARSAVITLEIDVLGWSYTDDKQRYSLRDELLSNISKVIDDAEGGK